MAKFGSDQFKISVTTSSGTTLLLDISNYVRTINGYKLNALLQESHAFGDAWVESLYTGIRSMDDITLGGYYDDVAASGPHALFGQTTNLGQEREIELDAGSSDVMHVDVLIASYSRTPTVGELTGFEVVLRPTGAVTTAT